MLGLHLAEKLRGAVALATYRAAGDEEIKQRAVGHLQKALAIWNHAEPATPGRIYRDMKLTHYNGNSFDANPDNLFHWERIRAEVARDVEVAVAAKPPAEMSS